MGAIYVCDWESDRMQKRLKHTSERNVCVHEYREYVTEGRSQCVCEGYHVSFVSTLPANSLIPAQTLMRAHKRKHAPKSR